MVSVGVGVWPCTASTVLKLGVAMLLGAGIRNLLQLLKQGAFRCFRQQMSRSKRIAKKPSSGSGAGTSKELRESRLKKQQLNQQAQELAFRYILPAILIAFVGLAAALFYKYGLGEKMILPEPIQDDEIPEFLKPK